MNKTSSRISNLKMMTVIKLYLVRVAKIFIFKKIKTESNNNKDKKL